MTKRFPLSITEVDWHDSQKVNQNDMAVEQSAINQTTAALINNHFGSGILPGQAYQNVLFDSDKLSSTQQSILLAGNFDGTGLQVALQPSDSTLGNQLEVVLSDSALDAFHGPSCSVIGRRSIKVLIIGVDFQGNTQYDRLIFHRKESQVTAKHYAQVLCVMFNDFLGNNNYSRKLGGRIVIRETSSFQLSREPKVVSQDFQPNLFFRDWKTTSSIITLAQSIQAGIGPSYTVDSLNITSTPYQQRTLVPNDVSSQIGQKFLATTNNIQKITLLLGVQDQDALVPSDPARFNWTGDLIISLYALQKTVNNPTDIIPGLAIDFDPEGVPLAQISYNQTTLKTAGIILTNVSQPVDFNLSETQVGSTTNSVIVPGQYYCVSIKRSGAATLGTLFTETGNNLLANARLTLFSGVWVDVAEEDLWLQIWSDSAKVSDGQAYDAGNGVDLAKTTIDSNTGATIDNKYVAQAFTNSGSNTLNIGIVQAIENETAPIQDERTGNPIDSRKNFSPVFSFVDSAGLTTLEQTSEPLIIGSAEDINPKLNPQINGTQKFPGLANGNTFTVVNPDPDLISKNIVGSRLIPNIASGYAYRIAKTTICTDGYGDCNGDGEIDQSDVARVAQLVGESLLLSSTQTKIAAGLISTLELLRADVDGDGYITSHDGYLISEYALRNINSFPVGSSFTSVNIIVENDTGRFDGYYEAIDGYVRLGYNNIIPVGSLSAQELSYYGYQGSVNIPGTDSSFITNLFTPISFQIQQQQFWQDYFLIFSSNARQVPASFTNSTGVIQYSATPPLYTKCADRADSVNPVDPGRNDFYIPDNLIIGRGQIIKPNGLPYSVDLEVAHIILELPQIPLNNSVINIFSKFVVDRGDGFSLAGFPAMRFADYSTVQNTALFNNQIRFGVSIQSFNPNLDGYSIIDGYGVVVDDIIGTYIDQNAGLLYLSLKDLAVDPIYMTLITKIEITVYLKKAGFINKTLTITPDLIPGLLSI